MLKLTALTMKLACLLGLILWPAVGLSQAAGQSSGEEAAPEGEVQEPAPLYVQPRGEIQIFDPSRAEQETPIQRAVGRMRREEERRTRETQPMGGEVATYKYTLRGEDRQQIIEEARLRALKSAAARLYFDRKIIMGRELLEPYLKRNGAIAIALTDPGRPRILAGGGIEMPVTVAVNLDFLFRDLAEKQFIAEPNLRPTVTLHVNEQVNGQADTSTGARLRIAAVMENNLFRVIPRPLSGIAPTDDLTTQPEALLKARQEAQRAGADILVTGTMAAAPVRQGEILYDPFDFVSVRLDLSMFRADTGALIAEVHDEYSATGSTLNDAIGQALTEMVPQMTNELAGALRETWGPTVLGQSDWRVLIENAQPDELERIYTLLRGATPGVEVYENAHYGDSAVVGIKLPEGTTLDLPEYLKEASEPQLDVRPVDRRRLVIQPL